MHRLYANTSFYIRDLSILGFCYAQGHPETNPFGILRDNYVFLYILYQIQTLLYNLDF